MNPKEQLETFILQSRAIGKTDDKIKEELCSAGWQEEVVTKALSAPLSIATPTTNEVPPGYAGFWHRVAASVADGILLTLISFVCAIPLGVLYFIGFLSEVILITLLYLISIGIGFIYYPYMEAKKGYTFGKQFIGIRVVYDETGQLLSLGRSYGRFFAKMVSAIPFGIGFLMAGFTKKKQALHDIIVGSVVLKTSRVNKYRTILTIIVGVLGPLLFSIFIVPLLVALMFGAMLSGVSSNMELEEIPFEELSDISAPAESFTQPVSVPFNDEELDSLLAATTIRAIINIAPDIFDEGYLQAGPAVVTWNEEWNDELLVYVPILEGVRLSDYLTIDILEAIDSSGQNVYLPENDTGNIRGSSTTYEIDAITYEMDEIFRDFGDFENSGPMEQVKGVLRFSIPQSEGTTYERSFDFTLQRQRTPQ